MIYILSIFYIILISYTEAFFGIKWDYHPDSVYYIENSENISEGLSYNNIYNNLYYYIVSLFNSNVTSLIYFNSLLYVLTNNIIYNQYIKNNFDCTKIEKIIIILIILNPYRAHLAIHVLKDTVIIFLFILAVVGTVKLKLPSLILLALTRVASVLYFLPYILKKLNLKMMVLLISLIIIYLYQNYINGLFDLQAVDMRFRDFDSVPNFLDQGFLGAILRFVVWPLLLISGLFIFFMPNILVLPIAFSFFLIQIWSLIKYKKLYFNFSILVTLGFFAFLVTGFTSFIRYTIPLITIIPIFLNLNKK